jgi:hypothetical protein
VHFLFLLAYDVWLATRWPDGAGGTTFGIGVGTLVLAVNVVMLSCYTLGCHAMRHIVGGFYDEVSKHPVCDGAYACSSALNYKHQLFAWLSLFTVGFADLYVRLCSMGSGPITGSLMANATTYTYDVLVIGAGGAGLRAAIEAANSGVSVGLICKSLLGKAHTVMAEGGMAAALANNDDRDSWRVHFADTMRGGQYVNNWRMAEIHAKEAPDRVRELEGWGAVFDRTKDGRSISAISAAIVSAAGARWGPHGTRADSNPPGPHRLSRRHRSHGAHRHRPPARRRTRGRCGGVRPRTRPLSRVLSEGR